MPLYGDLLHYYLCVKPGLSGLWQVSGRSNLDYARRAALDAAYVKTWSLFSDASILIRTIPAVLRRDGSC
jgi:lipopolysaccharide/colanic/teichoic acid biosynthesis glycosyltransferase